MKSIGISETGLASQCPTLTETLSIERLKRQHACSRCASFSMLLQLSHMSLQSVVKLSRQADI